MSISPLYEILVYIEDKGSAEIKELTFHGKNQIRGILGKMEAMKLVEKTEGKYSLSRNGQSFLNSILDVLHQSTIHWDNKWRFVSFSISEKNRSRRDKFRRELEGLGLRPYLNSYWITPIDVKDKIMEKAGELDIKSDVLILETENILGKNNDDLLSAWDFEKSRSFFEEFSIESERLLSDTTRSPYDIKIMIFKYALILNSQPQLPIELMPKDWPQFRANLQYKKVRRLLS